METSELFWFFNLTIINKEKMDSLPENLKAALKANRLLPLVGAGVSMSITKKGGKPAFPSWRELLEHAQQALKAETKDNDAELVRIFLEKNDYKSAAKFAYEGLKGNTWFKFVREELDIDFDAVDGSSLELPKAIWGLSRQLITLNYDKALEWTCPNKENVCVIDNNSHAELSAFQTGSLIHPSVWHLHGYISNAAELILTPQGYSNLYPLSESSVIRYEAALQVLRHLILSRTLLFIGCSLDDVDLLAELLNQQKIFSDGVGPHYVLVHKDHKDSIEKRISSNNLNIQVIIFSEYGRPLVDLIEKIKDVNDVKEVDLAALNVHPVVADEKFMKVALLSANPVNDEQEYGVLYKELAKLGLLVS
ncbi:MAG: SIR2 family protein [Cellvibrio sp.]|uniref:SIR2 family NAD-dependent protein deacylase n=1 Tax=Cellvibrio sp. TaxID=1965322 RepID=UPI0027198DBC|nr:SIR2 family protein [Cellvibrio sp.]